MAKMCCATMIAPHRIELEDVEHPEVDGNTVIVKVAGLGVCGSNLHFWNDHKQAAEGSASHGKNSRARPGSGMPVPDFPPA